TGAEYGVPRSTATIGIGWVVGEGSSTIFVTARRAIRWAARAAFAEPDGFVRPSSPLTRALRAPFASAPEVPVADPADGSAAAVGAVPASDCGVRALVGAVPATAAGRWPPVGAVPTSDCGARAPVGAVPVSEPGRRLSEPGPCSGSLRLVPEVLEWRSCRFTATRCLRALRCGCRRRDR